MDQDIKEEFKYIREEFKKVNDQFGKVNGRIDSVNGRIDKMSGFMMTHVALKEDLKDLATKDDLQEVKSDIFNKVDGLAYGYKNLDEEKTATGRRLDTLEAKLGIV